MKKFIIILCLLASSLFAHKLNVFTTLENGNLFVSAYFANGNGCQNCKVIIKTLDNKVLNEGLTNKDGEYEVKLDKTEFKVGVDAGGGHLAFDEIKADIDAKPTIQNEDSNNNSELKTLKDENRKLRAKIELLESQLQVLEIFKIIFGLLAIVGIFLLLKRIKK